MTVTAKAPTPAAPADRFSSMQQRINAAMNSLAEIEVELNLLRVEDEKFRVLREAFKSFSVG